MLAALAVFLLDLKSGQSESLSLIGGYFMAAMLVDIGLLILRLAAGGIMAIAHGWPKFMHYFDTNFDPNKWADPLGMGPALSHHLATGAELVCSILLMLGVLTRLSAIPLAFTMFVAFFVVHADDPFQNKELALVYLCMYLTLIFTGGGKFALLKSKTVVLS